MHIPARRSRARSALVLLPAFAAFAVVAAGPVACPAAAEPAWSLPRQRGFAHQGEFEECTIAVVGADASADGRPLIWKNRDTSFLDNQIVHLDDGRYPYVALVNAGETHRVWMGVNLAGFAILNALSYNLDDFAIAGIAGAGLFQDDAPMDCGGLTAGGGLITNGMLMKLALQSCSGIDEFEQLLEETNGRRIYPSNLAVLDASGRAALFEAGGNSYLRFDADNPGHAPGGILVRANFSLSADTVGLDTWRYRRADRLLAPIAAGRGIRIEDLLSTARDLVSEEADPYPLPYDGAPQGYPGAAGYIDTRETINRRATSAFGVIQGIRSGEHPALTTFLAGLGQPVAAPVLPFWVAAGETPPEVGGGDASVLNDLTRQRGRALYDFPGNPYLLDTARLVTGSDSTAAVLPLVERIEAEVLAETARHLAFWRESCACPDRLREVEWTLASRVTEEYRTARVVEPRDMAGVHVSLHPNPSRGGVWFVIEPHGPPPGEWLIEIFDPAGRKVAEIRDPDLRPGNSTARRHVFWDGAGPGGRPLPGGVYYGRIASPPSQKGLRLVRLQ